MTKLQRTQLTLPPDVVDAFVGLPTPLRNQYLYALRSRGWTLQSLADGSGITRERVRQIVAREDAHEHGNLNSLVGFPLPSPPEAEVTTKVKAVPNEPSAESVAELLRLYPEAKLVRANSSKHRVEAEAFTKLLNHVHAPVAEGGEGVSLYRLSEVLGVTHGGLRSRLGRYGYKPSAAYKPIKSGNRVN